MKDTVDLLGNCNCKEDTFCGITYKTLFIFRICILVCFILKKSYQRSYDHGINENITEQYFLERNLTKFM